MFNDQNGSGAGNLLTFLFGIAVGVTGTLVYAAMNEEQFNKTIKKTRDLSGQASDTVGEYVDQAQAKVKSIGDSVQGSIDSATAKLKGAATDVADDVEKSAHRAKTQINS